VSRLGARRWRAGLAPIVAAVALVACSGRANPDEGQPRAAAAPPAATPAAAETPPALAAIYHQRLSWTDCGEGFSCAWLRVPLDYARPQAHTIELSLVRLPATGPGPRLGSLVVNPGGPGGSGVDYARAARQVVPRAVRQRFDVVGFDPRGVGRSAPVDCVDDRAMDRFVALDMTPDTPAEHAALVSQSRALAAGCRTRSSRLLPHVSTVDVARDMDVLRAALGDRKLTYLGKSYGTFLGAHYAELFPTRIRALVLDGAVDPALSDEALSRAQAEGFESALRAFIADCVRSSDCPLGRDPAAGLRRIDALLAQADRAPLPAPNASGRRRVTEAHVGLGLAAALYDRGSGWPALRVGLARAFAGDGSVLLLLADALVERHADGSYSNQTEAMLAVNCIDRPESRDVGAYDRAAAEFGRVAPRFGAMIAYGALPCAFWPVPPVDTPHRITAAGAPPVLVVGTTRDPATPYAWARSLAGQLSSGVLLTYRGDGHTVYGDGNPCVDGAVNRYLIEARPPATGTTC
jgi:pimeloyl-ACP methyl ester carboxylesterase